MGRTRLGRLLLASCLGWATSGLSAAAADPQGAPSREDVAFFEKRVRPVLAERCFSCHSAQAKQLRGGLRLDSRAGLLRGGDSGAVVMPGQPEHSRLIQAIRYNDPALRMPPRGRLSADQVADLTAWVSQGAPYPEAGSGPRTGDPSRHWAFQPVRDVPPPAVARGNWPSSPLDSFILARLEARGLAPAPRADRPTLLRRVTFGLTGLPPTPAEIDAFLADQSPDAFAKVVDRLLASPAYGERWGRHWLDLVRYCDDFEEAWRYRDWVVRAFNADLPNDQFLLNQVAGDLLPAPRPGEVNAEGIVATTLLSLGPWSGIDRKKRLADIVDDQIDIVSRTFLGLTLACARCHNHKFDPITQQDYYALAGIFFSSRVMPQAGYLSHGTPRLKVPLVGPAAVAAHARHQARVREQEARLRRAVDRHYAAFARGLVPQTARYLIAAWEYGQRPEKPALSVEALATQRGLQAFALSQWIAYLKEPRLGGEPLLTHPTRDYDGEAGVHAWMASAERPWWGVNSTPRAVPIETFVLPPRSVSVNPGDAGGAVGWRSPIHGIVRIAGRLTDCDPHDGVGVRWIVDHVTASGRHELASGSLANGGAMRLDEGQPAERLSAVPVQPGDRIDLQVWLRQGDAHYDITHVELTVATLDGTAEWDLTRDLVDNLLEGNPHRDSHGNPAVWHFYDLAGNHRQRRMPAVEPFLDHWKAALSPAGKTPPDRRQVEEAAESLQRELDAGGPDSPLVHDLTGPRSPFWVSARDDRKYLPSDACAELARLDAELGTLKAGVPPLPCAHGIQEGGFRYSLYPGIQDAPIHIRGSYEQFGARVPRGVPKLLAGEHPPVIRSGSGRLELARWLGAADNPLTARVLVNRVWQHHFGEGLVRTSSNFGRTGEPPTHPELLDYLARRFIASGWSIKALHRAILLSSTYQQVSRHPQSTDPENRLWGRMNRQRLEVEALRDSLLAVAGRLDARPGGVPDGDPNSRRRMLYLRQSRSDKAGVGPLFDGANAAIHVEKRSASTVAPQALFLMNHPWVAEDVRRLAGRPEIAAATPDRRIRILYRLLYGREPSEQEVRLGREFLTSLEAEKPTPGTPQQWESYVHALILGNEFLFVD
jgi:hypothetical protein